MTKPHIQGTTILRAGASAPTEPPEMSAEPAVAGGFRRYWRLAFLVALVAILGVVNVVVSGVYPIPLLRTDIHCGRSSEDLGRQLQCLASDYVGQDGSVRSIELAVAEGDGSFSWAGSAGIAAQRDVTATATDTPIYIASVTKIYIATTVMALAERRLLSLDDPIANYLPAGVVNGLDVYQGHDYSREVTIRQLVSMTSGIPDYFAERGSDGKTMFDVFIADQTRTWTVDEMINRARTQLKPHFPPGTGVYYSDTGYQLLGKIIEKATGQPLGRVLEDYIFGPLGLQRTWLLGSAKPGAVVAAAPADVYNRAQNISASRAHDYWADGGIVSTATDMITFLRALNNGQLISRASLQAMQTWRTWPGSPVPVPGVQYGYGLWHFNLTGLLSPLQNVLPTWGASGSTGSFLYYSQDLDLYIAGTVNSSSSDMTPFLLMAGVIGAVSGNDNS